MTKEEGDEPIEVQEQDEVALLQQFRRLFAPLLDDSLQLYYQLNDDEDDEVQHVRIHHTVAEINELTSSEEETLMTQVNSSPTEDRDDELELLSTSSSSLYAIHTPSPAQPSGLLLSPQRLMESPISRAGSESQTITEQVQLHNPPNQLTAVMMLEDEPSSSHNNNTSCSLSSTLTDSKTLDGRTPIVV